MWNAEKGRRKKGVRKNITCGKEEIQLSLATRHSLLSELYVPLRISFSLFVHNLLFE